MVPLMKSTANAITPGTKKNRSPMEFRPTIFQSSGPAGCPLRSGYRMVPQPVKEPVRTRLIPDNRKRRRDGLSKANGLRMPYCRLARCVQTAHIFRLNC